jgi:hypothetical protein
LEVDHDQEKEERLWSTVVTLVKDVQVNGVLYRAGNTTLPAGAWHAFKYAMKES